MMRRPACFIFFAALGLSFPSPPSTRDAPFIETFHRGGKTLIYVLVVHHSPVQYPEPMDDPVFKTVRQVYLTTPPDAVVIEGVDPAQIDSYCEYTVQRCGEANYKIPGVGCGESAIAAYPATHAGIPVYTGEPSASRELSLFQAHGFTIEDFFAFWILNSIPQEKRSCVVTPEKFRHLVNRVVSNENHLLGTAVQFTVDDFTRWYAKKMPKYLNYLDADTNPYPPPGQPRTLLNTLSGLNTRGRDESVVKTIKLALQTTIAYSLSMAHPIWISNGITWFSS